MFVLVRAELESVPYLNLFNLYLNFIIVSLSYIISSSMDSIIIFCAKYLFIFVVALIGLLWLKLSKKDKMSLALSVIAAGIIAVVLDKLAGKLYFDPRPFTNHAVKPLFTHAADNGFPSEHTLFTVTLSTASYFYNKRVGIAAFTLSLIVGIARVMAHVHSPIDIIGAIAIGLVAGAAGFYLIQRFYSDKAKA